MYEHILVPLDGSELAEQALPHALALAKAFGSDLHLVTVISVVTVEPVPGGIVGMSWERETAEAHDYLNAMAAQVLEAGPKCTQIVLHGDVAGSILDQAEEVGSDLIVMSTHGRSGLGRWVYGSIADKVLRHASVPVLLIRVAE